MKSLLRIETLSLIVVIAALLIPVWWAAAVSLVGAFAYNVWIGFHGKSVSYADLGTDCIGVAIGALIAWLSIALFV